MQNQANSVSTTDINSERDLPKTENHNNLTEPRKKEVGEVISGIETK
jgi:hypothetical protein